VSVSQAVVSLSAEQGQVLGLLLPCLSGMAVDRAVVSGDLVRVWVHAVAGGAACPDCGTWSAEVHDRYRRRLRDAAAGGRRVLIWLEARVLRCGSAGCPRASFAEQPAGLASRYARRTPLLAGQLGAVAAALAGRAGSRLARAVLAVPVSRHTLVRMLLALPDPPAGSVRVLGVDDFALRRGRAYATLLVDMETGIAVDVLPDREQATVARWLREHPGAEVICRDRAGAYAAAARAAAPGAAQVADRWHLWDNLRGHVRAAAGRHRGCLAPAPAPAPAVPADPEAVIRARHRQVHALRAAGATPAQAAAELGLAAGAAGRYWRAADPGTLLAPAAAASGLDPFKPWLRQRWEQGGATIAALHREITAAGYRGVYMTTWRYLALLKLAAPARPPAPPTARRAASWILTRPEDLDPGNAAALAAIRGRCPGLDALAAHVAAFARILTGRHASQLDGWLARAEADPGQPELHAFAAGIRQDHDAVLNALTLPWNSGRVEGLNTRTKLLKRQMYGRASFPLLRKRILLNSTNPQP
jgi:transposase